MTAGATAPNDGAEPGPIHDALVIGGGAAGVGVAVALKDAGIENLAVLERFTVGASFALWPAETRFLTPSFPSNSIGMLDPNSIVIGSSPAHVLGIEHPTGEEYEVYLRAVAQFFDLPIRERVHVVDVVKQGDLFHLETNQGPMRAKHVVCATGEFQFPQTRGFAGSKLCSHIASIPSYANLEGDEFVVIGGYESGIDAAYHLALAGKRVRVLDKGCPWDGEAAGRSDALSTYSLQRMGESHFADRVELIAHTAVERVERTEDAFEVTTHDGTRIRTAAPPVLATGFATGNPRLAHLFEQRDDGFPLLTGQDESTLVPGVFLCGPSVRHGDYAFCFIHRFRKRFAVVAKTIATSLGLPAEGLETYRFWGMFLDDLSRIGQPRTNWS